MFACTLLPSEEFPWRENQLEIERSLGLDVALPCCISNSKFPLFIFLQLAISKVQALFALDTFFSYYNRFIF